MSNSGNWENWWKSTLLKGRVMQMVERHRLTPDISPESYFAAKRRELVFELKGKKLVYLDTKHWVNLCHVVVRNPKATPIYSEILEQFRVLRKVGKICCPLSGPLIEELMKQSDCSTRRATASIMDDLSGGVCAQNWLDLVKVEFAHHISRLFKLFGWNEAEFPFWTKVGYVFGEHLSLPESIPSHEVELMKKFYFDMRWYMTCDEFQAMPGWESMSDSFAVDWLSICENERNSLNPSEKFEEILPSYRNGLLGALGETIKPLLALCQGQAGSPMDHVRKVLNSIYSGTDPKAMPSVEVMAGLSAVIALDRNRNYQANDMMDFVHTGHALPYCDAFFCDNYMAQKLKDKRLNFQQVYQTEIGSRPEEIVAYLKSLE